MTILLAGPIMQGLIACSIIHVTHKPKDKWKSRSRRNAAQQFVIRFTEEESVAAWVNILQL